MLRGTISKLLSGRRLSARAKRAEILKMIHNTPEYFKSLLARLSIVCIHVTTGFDILVFST